MQKKPVRQYSFIALGNAKFPRTRVLCQELDSVRWSLLRVLKLAKLLFLLAITLVRRHGGVLEAQQSWDETFRLFSALSEDSKGSVQLQNGTKIQIQMRRGAI